MDIMPPMSWILCETAGARADPGRECSNPVPLPPPATRGTLLLQSRRSARSGLSCRCFREDLWASPIVYSLLLLSDRPALEAEFESHSLHRVRSYGPPRVGVPNPLPVTTATSEGVDQRRG